MRSSELVRCSFYLRTPVLVGATRMQYRYDLVEMRSEEQSMRFPPLVGDQIILDGDSYVVYARRWMPVGYGSMSWRHNQLEPDRGPVLDVMLTKVQPEDELFANEAPGDKGMD